MDIKVDSVGYSIGDKLVTKLKNDFSTIYPELTGDNYSEESLFDINLKMMEKAPDMFIILKDLVVNNKVDVNTSRKIEKVVGSIEGTFYL